MAAAEPRTHADHCAAVRERLARSGMRRAGPGSVTWKINREILVLAGWGRAILLQFAHPLVAAGIADHSHFSGSLGSSFRRLHSTVGAMLALTFGEDDAAVAAAAGINTIHDRVFGTLREPAGSLQSGERYSAHDPELLAWVHATLLESVPMAYELLVGPLTREERDRYCVEAAVMEPLLCIPAGSLPRESRVLDRYMSEMLGGGRINVTAASRTMAGHLLAPNTFLLRPAFFVFRLLTIGMLPPQIREGYGFTWDGRDQRAFERWAATLRTIRRYAPAVLREWPQARRAVRCPADLETECQTPPRRTIRTSNPPSI